MLIYSVNVLMAEIFLSGTECHNCSTAKTESKYAQSNGRMIYAKAENEKGKSVALHHYSRQW